MDLLLAVGLTLARHKRQRDFFSFFFPSLTPSRESRCAVRQLLSFFSSCCRLPTRLGVRARDARRFHPNQLAATCARSIAVQSRLNDYSSAQDVIQQRVNAWRGMCSKENSVYIGLRRMLIDRGKRKRWWKKAGSQRPASSCSIVRLSRSPAPSGGIRAPGLAGASFP